MFDRLLDLFKADATEEAAIDPALAAAALMFEVVWADHDIDDIELASMTALLTDLFELSAERVSEIVEATRANHDKSVGVYPFTRALNEQLGEDEKYAVLHAMWRIAFADEQVDAFEEHTIRRIADLMYVPHAKFIEAKLAARDNRSS